MQELKISANIRVCDYNELTLDEKNLIDAAKQAVNQAYAPYSQFQVGAAALLDNHEIVSGSNQENIAYPSGLCAERTALFYANSQFPNAAVNALAIAAYHKDDYVDEPITPCGACRQVMLEVQNRYHQPFKIYLYGKKRIYVIESVTDLLPLSFSSF